MHHYKISSQVFYLIPSTKNHLLPKFEPEKISPDREVPTQADSALLKRCEINRLRRRMEQAIAAERFEEAANLRDELYQLEKKEDA